MPNRRACWCRISIAVLLAYPAAGLAQPAPDLPGFTVELQLPIPSELSPDRVVLWSAGTLSVEQDTVIRSEDVTSLANRRSAVVAVPGASPTTTAVRINAKSEAEYVYSAYRIVLDRSLIHRDARSALAISLLGNARVLGATEPNASLDFVAGPTIDVAFPEALDAVSVSVPTSGTRVLAPGRYVNVTAGTKATLRLTAGAYFFEQLKTATDARLIIDDSAGPVRVFVRRTVELRGPQQVTTGSAQTFLLVALEKPVVIDRGFTGALVAPSVAVQLGNTPGSLFTGSFFGKTLVVREHSRVVHVASPLVWRPRIPYADSKDATRTCDVAFLAIDEAASDVVYVDDVVCPPAFCDAAGQPIATPDEYTLNNLPPGVSPVPCTASFGAGSECPVDPMTVDGTCQTSADCDVGHVCGELCTDILCTSVELRCGELAASCTGLPSGGSCDPRVWYECGSSLDRGAVSTAAVEAQMFLQADPLDSAYASTAEKATPHPTYPTVSSVDACNLYRASPFPLTTGESGAREAKQGSTEWGINIKPTFEHFADLTLRDMGDGVIRVGGAVGLDVEAIVRGTAVVPLHTVASATANRCGVQVNIEATLFDDLVDIPELLDLAHGLKQNAGDPQGVIGTDAGVRTTCETASADRTEAARGAKAAAAIARQVKSFVGQFGTTKDLCEKTELELGVDIGLCNDPTIQSSLAALDEWREVFDDAIDDLAAADSAYTASQSAVLVDDKLELLDEGDEFDKVIVHASIGIGPLSLTVQLRAVGAYNLSGDLRYRLALDGPIPVGADGIVSEQPATGEVRASAGAVMGAHLDVSLVAFVGAGIPNAASAGIEGTLELVDGTVDFNALGSMMMVSETDPRVVSASEWAGDPIARITELTNTNFRWVHGWRYEVMSILSMLNGAIDLIAQVGVDPFSVEFRENLVRWTGPVQLQSTLVDADPIESKDNFGAANEEIPLTRIAPSGPISPDPADFNTLYSGLLFDARDPASVAIGCGGPN